MSVLRSEWTKLRSVRRWVLGLLLALVITVLFSVVGASGSGSDANNAPELLDPVGPDGDRVRDQLHLVHQPMTGDGSITARVVGQADSHDRARAGVMIKESTEPGSRYAAVLVTPGHGVRFQANFRTDIAGSDAAAPRWLRLTRTGDRVTGYESADGSSWQEVGSVELAALSSTVEVGMFVNSPDRVETDRDFGSSSVGAMSTTGTATFDHVGLEPARPGTQWRHHDPAPGSGPGTDVEQDGVFTVTGSGDTAPSPPDADVTQMSLFGVLAGQIAVVAVAVLFITAEFKRGMIRTTFAASPRRGRVLAAKAAVIGGVTFGVGAVASVVSFLVAQPILRGNGFGPPAYPVPSLADWPVLRAVGGAALFLALVAVLGLAVGALLRRSAGAIAVLTALLVLPIILQGGLPLTAAQWLIRLTPAAGLAMTQSLEAPPALVAATDPFAVASPAAGLAVLAAYAAAALALGYWRLRQRDA